MLTENFDELSSALLGASFDVNSEERVAVRAEDFEEGRSGIDFSQIFFEPQIGETYLIKFLPNYEQSLDGKLVANHIASRSIYRNLPDPDRKGKTFRYVSSGHADSCPALKLFFDLHEKKQGGDAIAEQKIKKYLSRVRQGCSRVQIISSPNKEQIGQIRLMVFPTFGANSTISIKMDEMLNPTKEQIQFGGAERTDIFNIFGSPGLTLICVEASYDGVKGRDYSKSTWTKKNIGAIVQKEDGTFREFTPNDINNGVLSDEAKPFFIQFNKELQNPNVNVRKNFMYKEIGDPRNDEETEDYLKRVKDKVNRIVPIIRDKSLAEIANFGTEEPKSENSNSSILQDSIPDELKDIVGSTTESTQAPAPTQSTSSEIDDILNS